MTHSRAFSAADRSSLTAVDAARLARAKGYPYARPASSFLYVDRAVYTFPDSAWRGPNALEALQLTAYDGERTSGAAVLAGAPGAAPAAEPWTPVLAIGSNAGPEQLARKFPPEMFPAGVVVPAVRAVLEDFDVVYAPLISSYGSCTATLEHAPGTAVELFVTFLTPRLLARMHATEGAYLLCRLSGVCLHLGASLESRRDGTPSAGQLSSINQYNHQAGTLHLPLGASAGASPVAIQEMRAAGRRLPARTQVGMLRAVRDALAAREPGRDGVAGDPAGAAAAAGPPADPSDAASVPGAARPAPPAAGAPADGAHAAGKPPQAAGGAAGMQASLHGQRQCAEGGAADAAEGEERGAADGCGAGEDSLDAWILQNLHDEAARKARVDALVAMARPFAYARTQVLEALGDIYDHNVA